MRLTKSILCITGILQCIILGPVLISSQIARLPLRVYVYLMFSYLILSCFRRSLSRGIQMMHHMKEPLRSLFLVRRLVSSERSVVLIAMEIRLTASWRGILSCGSTLSVQSRITTDNRIFTEHFSLCPSYIILLG